MSIQRMLVILMAIAMSNSPLATTTAHTIAQAALLDPSMELVDLNTKIATADAQKQPLSTSSRQHTSSAAAASTSRADHQPSPGKDPKHPDFLKQSGILWDAKAKHWVCATCRRRTTNCPDHHHAGNCRGTNASADKPQDTRTSSSSSSSTRRGAAAQDSSSIDAHALRNPLRKRPASQASLGASAGTTSIE